MTYRAEYCFLCGFSRLVRDSNTRGGDTQDTPFWCPETAACAERWLRKFLSGFPIVLDSVILLGSGPQRQGVFEVAYQVNGQAAVKRRVLMPEVYSGGDFHRRSEHFHLLEFGADVRDTFAP